MRKTLLLIHANSDDRPMYARYLRRAGFRVLEAATTDAAVPLLSRVDAVITGLLVPGGIDTVDLIARVRHDAATAHVPIVVVTACIVTEMLERAARAGADAVLIKPCLPDALLRELRAALARRRAAA